MYINQKENAKIEAFLSAIDSGEVIIFRPWKVDLLLFLTHMVMVSFICEYFAEKLEGILMIAFPFFVFALLQDVRFFTKSGRLQLNSEGLTCFGHSQRNYYAWHEIEKITYHSTKASQYLLIFIHNLGWKKINCYSGYKEISLTNFMELVERKIRATQADISVHGKG